MVAAEEKEEEEEARRRRGGTRRRRRRGRARAARTPATRRTLHSLLLNLGQALAGKAEGLEEQGINLVPIDPKQAQQNAVEFVRKWKALGMPTA